MRQKFKKLRIIRNISIVIAVILGCLNFVEVVRINNNVKTKDFKQTEISENEENKEDSIETEQVIEFESIVQGFTETDLPNGEYTIEVEGEKYIVELINYYDDVVYTENVELGDDTTEYKTLVVKYHKNLTINENVTVTAKTAKTVVSGQTYNLTYKKGMYLCVLGELNNKGTISMTARGTYNCEGQDVYLWKNINDSYEFVPAVGGKGGEAKTGKSTSPGSGLLYRGNPGNKGAQRSTGGGGAGAIYICRENSYVTTVYGGAGAAGTSYSGGSGGGGVDVHVNGTFRAGDGQPNGGAGGAGFSGRGSTSWMARGAGGGAGNPGGFGKYTSSGQNAGGNYAGYSGKSGIGGLLIIYADILNNTGTISSNGSLGGGYNNASGGGSSGGGSINIFARIVEESGKQIADGGESASYGRSRRTRKCNSK